MLIACIFKTLLNSAEFVRIIRDASDGSLCASMSMCKVQVVIVLVGVGTGSVGSMPGNSATTVVCNNFCDNAHLVLVCRLRAHTQREHKLSIDTVWRVSEVVSRI